MFAIRDSQEPEDPLEDADIFPVSPTAPATDPTPISFDLPSTTSAATQPPSSTSIQTQKSQTPVNTKAKPAKRRRTVDDDGVGEGHDSIWEFPSDTPARATRRSKTVVVETLNNAIEVEESPVARKSKRRNSLSVVSEVVVTGRNTRQSPIINNASRKLRTSRRIDESDTEEITSPEPNTLDVDEQVQEIIKLTTHSTDPPPVIIDEIIPIDSNPRKRAIAVEIPTKPPRRSSTKAKKPLKEIVLENIPTPDPSHPKPVTAQQSPTVATEMHEELENVVLANAPSTPPRQMNVASILAKSPNRPAYRVGLSKRVNVEPLHGYLKRKAL